MIRDRVLLISCFVAGSAGGNRAAAHLINADFTGHAAADSRLPAAPAAAKKKNLEPCHNTTSKRISYVINSDLSLSEAITQLIMQLAGEFCHVPRGLKFTFILSFLTAVSVLATCTIIVICHVLI